MGVPVRKLSDMGMGGQLAEMAGLSEVPGDAAGRPTVRADLYSAFQQGLKLVDLTWEQQRYHEAHAWSVVEAVEAVDLSKVSDSDRLIVWNAGRAELTAKPSADRMARLADSECRRWQGKNDVLAAMLQAMGTWTRYWAAEEARHETGFNRLSGLLGLTPPDDATVLEYRKIYPEDEALRTVTTLVFAECLAAVSYAQAARHIREPGLRALFKRVAADEVHHMNYFISFAKGLVDSGEYALKECFVVAHLFLREGGELYGAKRERLEQRSYINWWDHMDYQPGMNAPDAIERKQTLMLYALRKVTGIACASPEEVEDKWMELVGC